MDRPEQQTDRVAKGLGWASLALAASMVAAPAAVARAAGVDDDRKAAGIIRLVGGREVAQGLLLLLGPRRRVWTRVAGDVIDLSLLATAVAARTGERRRRSSGAFGTILALTALDVAAAALIARRNQRGKGRPGPLQLQASITVNRPAEAVYRFSRDLENLPSFMLHLQSVTQTGDGLSQWVANAPIKGSVRWEAEMTGDEPGQRISWRSLPGADVDNSGTVHFAPAPGDRGTEVKVVLHYDVPGGRLGRAVAKLLGEEPANTLGGLNLYATESDTIDPDTVWMAELLATQAAMALGHARQAEVLNQALFTRKVISQAIGILMGRYELDEDRAFAFLTCVSQDSNTKLRDIAARLVETTKADNRLPGEEFPQEAGLDP